MEALSGDSRRHSTPFRHQVVRPQWSQGDQRWSLASYGEEQGLDWVFCTCLRVLGVNIQDYVVSSFFYKILDPIGSFETLFRFKKKKVLLANVTNLIRSTWLPCRARLNT